MSLKSKLYQRKMQGSILLKQPNQNLYLYVLTQVLFPLATGICIYFFFRGPYSRFEEWIGWSFPGYDFSLYTIPSILIGSFPDLSWCYAFLSLQVIVWGNWSKVPMLIKIILYITIPATEVLQRLHLLQGTYDIFDLFFYIATFFIHYQINKTTTL